MRLPVSDAVLQRLTAEQTDAIREQTAAIRAQATVLTGIFELLRALTRPFRPQNPRVTPVGENHMSDTLIYSVALDPLPSPTDVVTRRYTATVNGEERGPVEVPFDGAFPNLEVPQDANVKLVFVDVDDAGNASPEVTMEFVAVDQIAPAAPAGVSIQPVGEVNG